MKFLIDECLHMTLVDVATGRGHEAHHVNWLGLSGNTDWGLMRRIVDEDFTLVTNNAADFRRLYAREELHAGLVIIVPQVSPDRQRSLFATTLDELADEELVNQVIELELAGDELIFNRYALPVNQPE